MIVINGTVSDEIKQHLCCGGTHPVARRHANMIIAGGFLSEVNLWNPTKNKIELGAVASSDGEESASSSRLRTDGYIAVEPNTTYTISTNIAYVYVLEYGADKTYLKLSSGWKRSPYTFTTGATTGNIRLVLAVTSSGSTNMTVSDFEWLKVVKVGG